MDASGGTTPIAPAGHPKTAQSMEGSSTAGTTPISGDVGEMEIAMHPTTTTTEETPAAVVKESITVSEPQNQQVGEGRSTNGSGSILHEGEDEELGARRSSRKRSSRKKHKKHRRHSRGRSSSDLAGSGGAASELVRAVDGEREVAEHAASAPQHPSEARKEKKHRKHHSGSNRPRSANDGSTARWCEEEEGQPEGKKEEEQQQQQQHNSSVGMPPLPVVLPLHLQTVGQAEYATEAGSPLQSVRKATGTTPRSSSHASAVAATTPDQPASSAPATTAPVAGVCAEQEEADGAAPSPPPPIGPSTEAAEGPIFCDGSEEDEDAFRPVARPLSEPSAVAVEVLPPPSTTTSLILAPLPPLEEVCQARRSASAVVEVQEDLDGAAPAAAAAAETHLNFSDEDDEMSEGLRRLQQYPFLSTTDEEMVDVDASSQSHPLGSANPRSHPQDSRPPHQHREYSHADQNDLRHRGTEEQDNDFSPATGDTATEVDESLYKQPLFSCLQDRSVVNGWQLHHPRRHAFELPLHHYQVIALVVKVVGAILYFSSVLPAYIQLYVGNYGTSSLIECIIFTLLVVVLMGLLFTSYFILSFRNVTDESNTGDVCVYCSRRTPDTAYHCRACNRCVDGFDHHCKWLNTCIGKNNYRLFITYLASASSGMFVTFVASLVLLAQWWHQLSHFSLFFRIAPLILCVLMALGLGPILHLFLFHLILIRLDTSTIHYMQEKRRRVARGEPPGGVLCY